MKAEVPGLDDERARHLTDHALRADPAGGWTWKFDERLRVWPMRDITQDEVETLWRAIACPVLLLLFGALSWPSWMPARLKRTIPGARGIEFADAGHWLHHDRFDRFLAETDAFLTGADGFTPAST